jgi:hypothetical protein
MEVFEHEKPKRKTFLCTKDPLQFKATGGEPVRQKSGAFL